MFNINIILLLVKHNHNNFILKQNKKTNFFSSFVLKRTAVRLEVNGRFSQWLADGVFNLELKKV